MKHLYNLNSSLERDLSQAGRTAEESSNELNSLRASISALTRVASHRESEFDRLNEAYLALKSTRDDSSDAFDKLRSKSASQKAHIASQDGVIAQLQRDKEHLTSARDADALELAKFESLKEEFAQLLQTNQHLTDQLIHTREMNAAHSQSLTHSDQKRSDLDRSLEGAQRLLDEHVRQSALDAQHLAQLKALYDQKIAEKQARITELEAQVDQLRSSASSTADANDPHNAANKAIQTTLDQARANCDLLEQRNGQLTKSLEERDKMINDLLTSSEYRREVLIKKGKAVPPDQKEKKSRACVVM